MTSTDTLKEEWMNFLAMEYYHGDLNVAKRHDANTFADWWLSKLTSSHTEWARELKEKVEKLKNSGSLYQKKNEYEKGYNKAVADIISLLSPNTQ